MQELTDRALGVAKKQGATHAEVRVVELTSQSLSVRNGKIAQCSWSESVGFGVRVIVDGAWGFSAGAKLTKGGIEKTTRRAVEVARASASLKCGSVTLAAEAPHQDTWVAPQIVDPFSVPVEEKLQLLFSVDKVLRKGKKVAVAGSRMGFRREKILFANSEGALIRQVLVRSGAGYTVTASSGGEIQDCSYPCSFGGQHSAMGYELIGGLALLENAERIRDEAEALLRAAGCPSAEKDVIIDGPQLALQIHESCGHPSELDRVLGMEANFAGTSFMTPEKMGKLRYGSRLVNLVADTTLPTGLATRGFDDEGVAAQRWHIVKDGILVGYQTSREVAPVVGEKRSRGCARADGWWSVPMIRITNLSFMPGDWELEELIGDTKDGVLLSNNRSWSIDQRRLNFQFGTEIGWEIKKGKVGRMLKNPTYQGITPKFWASCDAICNERHWKPWGVVNCGKGQPMQVSAMTHGTSPARFRKVTVGVQNK